MLKIALFEVTSKIQFKWNIVLGEWLRIKFSICHICRDCAIGSVFSTGTFLFEKRRKVKINKFVYGLNWNLYKKKMGYGVLRYIKGTQNECETIGIPMVKPLYTIIEL